MTEWTAFAALIAIQAVLSAEFVRLIEGAYFEPYEERFEEEHLQGRKTRWTHTRWTRSSRR